MSSSVEPEVLTYRCYGSGLLALARGDVAAYRAIAAESFALLEDANTRGGSMRLGPRRSARPRDFAREAGGDGRAARRPADKTGGWHRIMLGNALFRAGRDKEALAAIEKESSNVNGKAVVGLIHAHGGRSETARRWLGALERDLEETFALGTHAVGSLRPPGFWPLDVLRADILRREAYASLGERPPSCGPCGC